MAKKKCLIDLKGDFGKIVVECDKIINELLSANPDFKSTYDQVSLLQATRLEILAEEDAVLLDAFDTAINNSQAINAKVKLPYKYNENNKIPSKTTKRVERFFVDYEKRREDAISEDKDENDKTETATAIDLVEDTDTYVFDIGDNGLDGFDKKIMI